MKKLLLVLIIFPIHLHAQDQSNEELRTFLAYAIDSVIMQQVNKKSQLVISPKMSNKYTLSFCERFSQWLNMLSSDELSDVLNRAKDTVTGYLTIADIGKKEILLSDTVKKTSWKQTLCKISNPLFFRNNDYCLFAYDITEAGGKAMLFKKVKYKWTVYANLCMWYE